VEGVQLRGVNDGYGVHLRRKIPCKHDRHADSILQPSKRSCFMQHVIVGLRQSYITSDRYSHQSVNTFPQVFFRTCSIRQFPPCSPHLSRAPAPHLNRSQTSPHPQSLQSPTAAPHVQSPPSSHAQTPQQTNSWRPSGCSTAVKLVRREAI